MLSTMDSESETSTPRFIADVNVGKLAKWLRAMGCNTLFINPVDDDELVRVALQEGRILLTRDEGIAERRVARDGRVKVLLVRGDRVWEQLRQVMMELGLDWRAETFSLCLRCNEPLVPLDKAEVRHLVPAYVYRTHDRFTRCPTCGRIYWPGTHWEKMRRKLQESAR